MGCVGVVGVVVVVTTHSVIIIMDALDVLYHVLYHLFVCFVRRRGFMRWCFIRKLLYVNFKKNLRRRVFGVELDRHHFRLNLEEFRFHVQTVLSSTRRQSK